MIFMTLNGPNHYQKGCCVATSLPSSLGLIVRD